MTFQAPLTSFVSVHPHTVSVNTLATSSISASSVSVAAPPVSTAARAVRASTRRDLRATPRARPRAIPEPPSHRHRSEPVNDIRVHELQRLEPKDEVGAGLQKAADDGTIRRKRKAKEKKRIDSSRDGKRESGRDTANCSSEPTIRGRKPRRTRKGGKVRTGDGYAAFLSEIREDRLLEHVEEIELANHVQWLVELENVKTKLTKKLSRSPTISEWALAARKSPRELEREIQVGTVAKNKLVTSNLRLVHVAVQRFEGISGRMNSQDLLQEGSLALYRAAEKFDGSKGFKFSTYASWWIKSGIMRGIEKSTRTIRLPIRISENFHKIRSAQRTLSVELGRAPTEEEISKAVDMTVPKLRFTIEAFNNRAGSLDEQLTSAEGDSRPVSDTLQSDENLEDKVVESMLQSDLDHLMKQHLKPRERAVLRMRFGLVDGIPHTLAEVSKVVGISNERVRQVVFSALEKLRNENVRDALGEYLNSDYK